MQDIIKTILAAKRKSFLSSKPIFRFHAPAAEMDLFMTARKLNCKMTNGLSRWLRTAGYGDINETLMFRSDFFSLITEGTLKGHVTFARDELGNTYAFNPKDGSIYLIDHLGESYANIANDFLGFLEELIKRNYDLPQWRESLVAQHRQLNATKN